MKPLIILLFIVVAATSCKKQATPNNTSTSDKEVPHVENLYSRTIDIDPRNPANPYDSAGILHNIVLSSVRIYMNETGDESVEGAMNFIQSYFKTHRNLDKGNPFYLIPNGMMKAVTNDHDRFLSTSPISEPMRMVYTEFIDSLKRFTEFNRKKFKTMVMYYEKLVMQSREFNDTEKRTLLIALSVARYSGFYWSEGMEKVALRGPKKVGFLRKLGAVVSAAIGDGIAAAGLLALGAPFDELVEISVTGSQLMYFWITGAYNDTH